MKKLTPTIALIITATILFAQAPQFINYQIAVRNPANEIISNQNVNIRISILQTSGTGTAVYTENHSVTTNQFGIANLQIGTGTVETGTFAIIDWKNDIYFIKEEIDITGGTTYEHLGTSQLLSVPYALYADNANVATQGTNSAMIVPEATICNAENEGTLSYNSSEKILQFCDGNEWKNLYGNINATYVITDASYTGGYDGAIDITITGGVQPYTYNWSTGATTEDITALSVGTYSVTITDSKSNPIDLTFTVSDQVKDYDGNVYNYVKIGNQIWMKENLKVTHYPDGTAIPLIEDNTAWANLADNNTDDAYCYYSNNASSEADTYGALYTWAAAMGDNAVSSNTNPSGVQGVCPNGWHLPSNSEWTELIDYLGGETVAGGKMKEVGTTHWNSPNEGADNSSGFAGLPGGERYYSNGTFIDIGDFGLWWTSTEGSGTEAYFIFLNHTDIGALHVNYNMSNGNSVRCVRD